MNPLSICIVSHKAYGAITGGKSGHVGGVEWQTTLMARWFAQRGHQVSMLTWDEGGPPVETIDGVKVIKIARPDAGVKGVRFFHPKWTGLNNALRAANADVYYHNTAECVTGQVALWCRRNGRAFVFSAANNTDCDPRLPQLRHPWVRMLYRYGLRTANLRIVQTQTQREALEKYFGQKSVVIPMPCPDPGEVPPAPQPGQRRILWIARICTQKRPDLLLDLARACPNILFDMVGPFPANEYGGEIRRRALATKNVLIHGSVSRDQVARFYEQAFCLCCTSDYEGFPNTFLEAWSRGLPIISTFDPDSLIESQKLGLTARDTRGLQQSLELLLASPDLYSSISRNARQYFVSTHSCTVVFPTFEREIAKVVLNGRSAGRAL